MNYNFPRNIIKFPDTREEVKDNIVSFLLANDIPIHNHWRGRMYARHQRKLLGFDVGWQDIVLSRNYIVASNHTDWNLATGDCIFKMQPLGIVDDPLVLVNQPKQVRDHE